jgi:translocation and assembly module TamB
VSPDSPEVSPAGPEVPSAVPPPPAGAKVRGRRWWLWPLVIAVQLVLLVVLALVWVLGSESGLRSALVLAEDLAPGLVRIQTVEGRIAGDLHLEGIALRLAGLHLDAASLDLSWRPLGALTGTLRVRELAARQVRVLTAPRPPSQDREPLTLPDVVLPLAVDLEHASVEGLQVGALAMGGESPAPPLDIDRIALSASLSGGRLELRELALALPEPRLAARAHGRADLTGAYPLGLELAWSLTLPDRPPEGQGGAPAAAPRGAPATLSGMGQVSGDLSRLHLDHRVSGALDLNLTGEATGVLDRPAWDAALELRRVDLPALSPGSQPLDLRGTLRTVGTLDEAKVTGTLEGEAEGLPDFGRLVADLDLTWAGQTLTVRTLKVNESVSGAWLDAGGELALGQDTSRFDFKATWERLRWPLTGAVVAEARAGKLAAAGTFAAYRYQLSAEVAGPDLPAAGLELAGEGGLSGSRIQSLHVDTLDGRIDASGNLAWDPSPTWDLELAAKDLDPGRLLPDLSGRVSFQARSAGGLDAYDLNLTGETGGPALPAAEIALTASGDLHSARIAALRLDTLDGRIEGKGEAAWDPEPRWDIALSAEGLDPSKHWPGWPGRLGGRVATQGLTTAAGPDLGVQLDEVKGELRGYPVAAAGRVRLVGETVTVEEINASSGPSKARFSGTIGERLDLAFAVDSPDLATLLPEARGSIKADGTALGTREAPEVKLQLGAQGVQMAGQGVASLEGNVDLGLGPDGRFDIRLKGKDLSAGGLGWRTLEVRGEGAMADHRLSADLNGDVLSVRLRAGGALKPDNAYQGNLAELELTSKDYGQWRLQRSATVLVAQPKVSAGPLCLRDGRGSGGCVRFEQTDAGKWDAELDLDRLAFDLLGRFLPSNLAIQGAASLKGRFAADGPILRGTAALSVPEGRLQVSAGSQTQDLDFSNARFGVDSDSNGLSARLHLPLAGIGGADADLTLAGWRLDGPARPEQPLSGRVQARVADLGRFASLVPDLTGLTGSIDLDLGLQGTLKRPGIKGGARVSGGGFGVPIIGLKASNLDLSAEAQSPTQILHRGGVDLGGGRLDLTGDSVRDASGWLTKIRIAGQKLKVADSKQYFVVISPDIGVQLGPDGLSLTGELRVPEARIRPRDIPPGTVSPSGDVVLDEGAAAQAEPFPIVADLRLVLGDEVSIDAFGLRGLLRGDLRVIKSPGREPVGDGQISVEDGTYRLSGAVGVIAAVGKPLKVEQGILVFAKTPLSNPGLVLTAQRQGGDTTAGVRVLGTIKKPKLAFFSESDPDMSQSEITSYLVTGIPPKRGNADDARALAVGTYISPKLYMEYESNLGSAADKVKLRYELSNRIELQTETGSGQGADIFYKFEH